MRDPIPSQWIDDEFRKAIDPVTIREQQKFVV